MAIFELRHDERLAPRALKPLPGRVPGMRRRGDRVAVGHYALPADIRPAALNATPAERIVRRAVVAHWVRFAAAAALVNEVKDGK